MTDSTLLLANASLNSLTADDDAQAQQAQLFSQQPGIQLPPPRKLSNHTHTSRTDPDATLPFESGSPR